MIFKGCAWPEGVLAYRAELRACNGSCSTFPPPLQDSMELVFKQSKAVAVTSMSFPLGDVNNFVVGSEDGSVYMSCRHGRCVCWQAGASACLQSATRKLRRLVRPT